MVRIQLTIPPEQLAAARVRLDPKDLPRAIAAGVNRTASTVRTHAARSIREQTGVRLLQRDIVSRIGIRKATASKLSATVVVTGSPLSLYKYFDVKQTPPTEVPGGVYAKLYKGGDKLIPHAFVATLDGGHTGVFVRKLGAQHVKTDRIRKTKDGSIQYIWSALPIKEQMAPGTASLVESAPGLLAGELAAAGPILEKNVASQVERFAQQ